MARSLKESLAAANSDEFVADYSEAREGGFAAIEEGDYDAVVIAADGGTSKEGNPKVVFQFKITGPTNEGRVFFRHCPLAGSGSGILRDTLKALGANPDRFGRKDVLNKACVIQIATQKGEDPTDEDRRQEVKKVKAAKGAAKTTTARAAASSTARPGSARSTKARSGRLA